MHLLPCHKDYPMKYMLGKVYIANIIHSTINMQAASKNSRIKGQSLCKWIFNPCFLGIFSAKFGLH